MNTDNDPFAGLGIALTDAKRYRALREAALTNDQQFKDLFAHNCDAILVDSDLKFNRVIDATIAGERI